MMFVSSTGASLAMSLVALAILMEGAGNQTIQRFTIDGGGAMESAGAGMELRGTIGQPDAGQMTGGDLELSGGFWFELPLGDCEDDGDVDLFDHELFEACMTGPAEVIPAECRCSDINASETVDLLDYAQVAIAFTGR